MQGIHKLGSCEFVVAGVSNPAKWRGVDKKRRNLQQQQTPADTHFVVVAVGMNALVAAADAVVVTSRKQTR